MATAGHAAANGFEKMARLYMQRENDPAARNVRAPWVKH
jgi:hypothetical protein